MKPGTPDLRARWGLDPDVAYLNHGSFGATPLVVLAEQDRLRRELEREPVLFLHRTLPARLDAARQHVARFLTADPGGLAFVPNATTGVATVLGSFEWRTGDEVVLADQGYGAMKQQLRRLGDRFGVRTVFAEVPFPIRDPQQVVDAFAKVLSPRTRLVIVDWIASPTALIFPVDALVALCRQRAVPVLVDGAHAPGFLPVDLNRLAPDFFTGNLHKWVCAAKGCAVLWVGHGWRMRVRPLVTSHGYGGQFHEEHDWTGTFDPTAWLSSPTAIGLLESYGVAKVQAANHELVQEGRRRLAWALGVDLPHPDDPALYGAMAAVPFPRGTPKDCVELTRRMYEVHRIEVPFTAYDQRVWVRISGQLYNRPEEYERLAEALRAF